MSMINPEMMQDDYESTLRLLLDIQAMMKVNSLTDETKLRAINDAITEAVGGAPEGARDFIRDVAFGLIE